MRDLPQGRPRIHVRIARGPDMRTRRDTQLATTNHKKSRPGRSLLGLALVIAAIFGTIAVGVVRFDAAWTPKLALDLEGGTQIILQPVTTNGAPVEQSDLDQAIAIIRQRVDSTGVAEAEIASQGGNNIVVSLPGKPSEDILDLVRQSAQMQFRPVLSFASAVPAATPTGVGPLAPTDVPSATPSPTPSATAEPTADPTASVDPSATPTPAASAEPTATDGATTDPTAPATTTPSNPSDLAQITPELAAEFAALTCPADGSNASGVPKDPNAPIVACSTDGLTKYILGPMEIAGTNISSAVSGPRLSQTGAILNDWAVSIEFNGEGAAKFAEVTKRLSGLPTYETWIAMADNPTSAPNMFAMVLDNQVVSAPGVENIIADGKAEITGSFDRDSAETLANQLKFGALPLTFEVQSQSQISATLGSEQLQKGILAGLIGLLLVVLYSLVQYRALGLVTVASLIIAGVLTYGLITLLSWWQGYRLSLPGVTGLIVAIGITADSFIVYFERIRDELRDGRSLATAVDTGWDRARRTILAADAVNLLAAVVLYFLAVGGVRGFAFTLGLTTVVDVIVVFYFTHPLMKLLSRTKFFAEGHPGSGLDPHRLGATSVRYAGRGRVSRVQGTNAKGTAKEADQTEQIVPKKTLRVASPTDALPTMTIAERRAAEAAAVAEAADDDGPGGGTENETELGSETDKDGNL